MRISDFVFRNVRLKHLCRFTKASVLTIHLITGKSEIRIPKSEIDIGGSAFGLEVAEQRAKSRE